MNQNNDLNLIPSDYCLIYSCVIKYQSIILNNIKTKSIHCLDYNFRNHNNLNAQTNLNKSYSSHLENCNCCAILNQNSKANSKLKINSNQNFNQNSTKTASTSTINSKLKNTGRLSSSATGHRMPNNFSKNANPHNSTASNKINENVQSGVGVKQTPKNQPIRITDSSAIQLLAEDVESRLEALLRTFIQEEKLRQEARYNSLMGKRSASLSALNSEYSDVNQDLNVDYLSGNVNRSIYNQQQLTNNKNSVINKSSSNNFGFIKPQQHRMQQSYQLQNSQNVNTQPQQKTTTIKTSHRLDSSPSRSNVQNNLQNTKVSRTRSPSPTGRSTSTQTAPNIIPVNRNNLFGQHTRTDQNKKTTNTATTNKPTTTNYLNLHQRSHSPSKDNQQQAQLNKNHSSQLDKSYLQQFNQQSAGPILHRLYSPNYHKMYDPFSTNSSQFGRSKDDSHIRRVVVYNLNKDTTSVEKKPVIIEQGSISMNGTLNNNNASNTSEKIGTNLNDNQAIRLRSAKVRSNSPNRVGMMNGNIGHNIQSANLIKQQQANASVTNRINSPANTITNLNSNNNKLSSSSSNSNNFNSSNISSSSVSSNKKKLSTGSKVTTSATTNSRLSGHENSSLKQFKDQNNNLDLNSQQQSQLNVGGSAAQLNVNNTERKVVRKVVVKELDGSNSNSSSSSKRSESVLNNNTSNNSNLNKLSSQSATYQQHQRLSPILNGDLNNSVAKMATLNQQPTINSTSNLNNQSSLDILLSERDRILNNRDQYKLRNSNFSSTSSSDVNNNYILSKNNKFNNSSIINDSSSTTNLLNNNNDSSAAGLLNFNNDELTNRNLPLSSSSSTNSVAKRKPLIDRYSPFSIVNEARQRWEEKNGMNGQLSTSRFNYLDDNNLKNSEHDNDLIFNEYFEQSDEEVVDSSMVLIRSRLSRILNTNGNVANLPNSTIISLLNHISNKNRNDEDEISTSLPLPACLSELNNATATLNNNSQLNTLNNTSSSTAINSMRPPVIKTNQTDCNQSNGQNSTSQNRANTVKPFLSKGSVAERVLLFEKHPQLKQIEEKEEANRKEENALTQKANLFKSPVSYSSWRDKNKNEVVNLSTSFEQNLKGRPPLSRQRSIQESLPLFYFPHGKPQNNSQQLDQLSKQVNQFFKTLKDGICLRENLVDLCKASNFPIYWKEPLFLFLAQNNQITHDSYLTFWRKLNGNYFDEASKFVFILTKGKRNFILPEDFIPMIQDVINSHPGLLFLKFAFEFHSRYVHTVIARIYYTVNRTWSGRISINELRKSNFLQIVKLLQDEDDINQITDYFSYEHFYVIYCKFWGLDKDHDLIIDKYDLSRHNDGAISSRMIDRIFSGAVTQSKSKSKQMTYQEFVFFLISEEDKKTETSIEYWFRCLDLDGDGFLKPEYELEYFYEEQVKRMESIGIEALPFTDLICQMLDMINPENPNRISLSDLKKCSMTYIFLDTFFNLHKYLLHEQRDPFSNKDDQTESDWNKFAAEEYTILVQEEQNQINETEKENQYNYNQHKYMSFVNDDKINHDNNSLKKEFDDYYDTTDQEEDYDYLYTDDESLY